MPETDFFKKTVPAFGVIKIGSRCMAAICTLNEPGKKREMMRFDEIVLLYETIKKTYAPENITIYTNRGVEIALDSKPDDLEVIKVPHAIFADLGK